jgi:hypothetical protein
MAEQKLPIGYWLKKADDALTNEVNRALRAQGFDRFQWQLLNFVSEGGTVAKSSAFDLLQTFVDAERFDVMLDTFINDGWLQQRLDGSGEVLLSLTEEGQAKHSALLALQTEVRRKAMEGISPEDYQTVIRVLERLVANMQSKAER